eukprot:CAMPEP_0196741550 /NCGR_PEP_ID=MMETSP1091-20130531/41058_1 /TAXON_ID=302021 /ORGANISM="Rhodomonas sp., Strain CCMP768" /LENGTH=235 /DNA_ID=CAMNT_0042087299 /DNA_START=163 /DNA_END=870 /DNA_ORIENTATION=+
MERIFMERNDFTIFHEPFSVLYYVHEAKGSAKFEAEVEKFASNYEDIKKEILAAAEKGPVFFKDMAYHPFQHIMGDDEFLKRLTNTFIIRDPADTINSHYAMNPDLTREEVGYERQLQLFRRLEEVQGKAPILVDSEDLTTDPNQIIEAYCQSVGIIHVPEALEWEPGQPEAWKSWESWHKDASQSKGIIAKKNSYAVTVENDSRLREMHDLELPFYNALRAQRIAAAPGSPPTN